jgi:hypothetical protein
MADPHDHPVGSVSAEPQHDIARDTCPFCGSSEVTHLVIGMPAGPDAGAGDPEWVAWVGCVHPGYTRRCESCGSTWTRGQVFADLAELMAEAEAADLEDLCDWLSEDHELDAWVITDDDGHFEVGFGNRGVTIEFPIPAQELWNTLDELHEEAADELTAGHDGRGEGVRS